MVGLVLLRGGWYGGEKLQCHPRRRGVGEGVGEQGVHLCLIGGKGGGAPSTLLPLPSTPTPPPTP